jgi:hypothetical protein
MSESLTQTIQPSQLVSNYRCIIGIANTTPYDTSVFVNNETTYYTSIYYGTFSKLFGFIKNKEEPDEENLKIIYNNYYNETSQVLFRFLCAQSCKQGMMFSDKYFTKLFMEFVKFITAGTKKVLIEFSDHSMSAFFRNWDNDFMEFECPILISRRTTSGLFTMNATRDSFLSSSHPTLQQIATLSADENISITFQNMNLTQQFTVKEGADFVKILSTGHEGAPQSKTTDDSRDNTTKKPSKKRKIAEVFKVQPVHCEFPYQNGIIIVSSTHWCNIENVISNVSEDRMKECYIETFGEEASAMMERELEAAPTPQDKKRIISRSVKQISSGTPK